MTKVLINLVLLSMALVAMAMAAAPPKSLNESKYRVI